MRTVRQKAVGLFVIMFIFLMAFSVTGSAAKLNTKKLTLTVGESYQMQLLNTTKTVTWKSSKPNIAPITYATGNVYARKAGTATLTATAGSKTYKCKLTIKDKVPTQGASENAQRLLTVLQKMSDQVKSDVAAGRKWTYNKPNYKNSFADEVAFVAKGGTGHSMCSHIVRWSLISTGIMPSGGNIYGSPSGNGKVVFNAKAQNDQAFQSKIEIIDAYKTPNELLKEGNLLPGDICVWCMYHISVYAGNGTWFDAGRGADGGYRGGTYYFNSFGPITGWMNTKVGQIVRLK